MASPAAALCEGASAGVRQRQYGAQRGAATTAVWLCLGEMGLSSSSHCMNWDVKQEDSTRDTAGDTCGQHVTGEEGEWEKLRKRSVQTGVCACAPTLGAQHTPIWPDSHH